MRIKVILQYTVILGITGLLIAYSLRGITVGEGENKWDYIIRTWQLADKGWLMLMALLAVFSHVVRAERWRMLVAGAGSSTTLGAGFLSLMVGYLVNLVIPRGGEVSRCYNLYKLSKTPVDRSLGTVIAERVVDLLCLVALLVIAFLVESDKLLAFVGTLPIQQGSLTGKLIAVGVVLVILVMIVVVIRIVAQRNERFRNFLTKTWQGLRAGLLAVFTLERKGLFIFYSLLIWALYFAMSYTVIQAFDQTSHLGMSAVLSLFAIGSIAMAAPLPGGTGSYHTLVPAGLTFLYQVPTTDAVAFVFVFHGWQTLIMITGGAVALLITEIMVRRANQSN